MNLMSRARVLNSLLSVVGPYINDQLPWLMLFQSLTHNVAASMRWAPCMRHSMHSIRSRIALNLARKPPCEDERKKTDIYTRRK